MSEFSRLLNRADTLRSVETDPIRSEWLAGYIRGLRRAHYGNLFGTVDEHERLLLAVDSDEPLRAALGRGYRAGLTLTQRDPD